MHAATCHRLTQLIHWWKIWHYNGKRINFGHKIGMMRFQTAFKKFYMKSFNKCKLFVFMLNIFHNFSRAAVLFKLLLCCSAQRYIATSHPMQMHFIETFQQNDVHSLRNAHAFDGNYFFVISFSKSEFTIRVGFGETSSPRK